MFIAILTWGAMIHFHWKAALISFLSVNNPKIPFRSTHEIIQSPYQITLLKDSSYQMLFEKTPSLKTVWDTKFLYKEMSLQSSSDKMLSLVLNDDYAMYEAFATLQTFKEYKECLVMDIGFSVETMNFAFALPKDSPFKNLLNNMFRKMIETGTMHRLITINVSKNI